MTARVVGAVDNAARALADLAAVAPLTRTAADAAATRASASVALMAVASARELLDVVSVAGVFPNNADGAHRAFVAGAWERETRFGLVLGAVAARRALNASSARLRKADNGLARYVIVTGDTLQSIAAAKLGDWKLWVRIAELNNTDPSSPLAPGTVINLPPRTRS